MAVRQRRHPVGWLFLALALALSVGAAGDAYALEHGVVRGDTGAAAGLALVAGQASFIAWFALVAAVLHLTPTGRPLSRRWAYALAGTAVAAAVALAAKAVQDTAFDPPYAAMRNPWAVSSIAGLVDVVAVGRASRSRCSGWSWPRPRSSCGSGARRGRSASSCVGWR